MLEVDAHQLGADHVDIARPAHDRADWTCDGGWIEEPGRHLVQERLEQVVIVAVDERDTDVDVAQRPGGGETAEPGADDHDVWMCGGDSHQRAARAARRSRRGTFDQAASTDLISPLSDGAVATCPERTYRSWFTSRRCGSYT
jgi:hypothetical protein